MATVKSREHRFTIQQDGGPDTGPRLWRGSQRKAPGTYARCWPGGMSRFHQQNDGVRSKACHPQIVSRKWSFLEHDISINIYASVRFNKKKSRIQSRNEFLYKCEITQRVCWRDWGHSFSLRLHLCLAQDQYLGLGSSFSFSLCVCVGGGVANSSKTWLHY